MQVINHLVPFMNHFRDQLSTVRKNYVWWLRSLQSWAVWSATTTTFPGDATMRFGTKLSSSNLAFEGSFLNMEPPWNSIPPKLESLNKSNRKFASRTFTRTFEVNCFLWSPGSIHLFLFATFFGKRSWTETRNTIPEKNLHTASNRLTRARCIKMHEIP